MWVTASTTPAAIAHKRSPPLGCTGPSRWRHHPGKAASGPPPQQRLLRRAGAGRGRGCRQGLSGPFMGLRPAAAGSSLGLVGRGGHGGHPLLRCPVVFQPASSGLLTPWRSRHSGSGARSSGLAKEKEERGRKIPSRPPRPKRSGLHAARAAGRRLEAASKPLVVRTLPKKISAGARRGAVSPLPNPESRFPALGRRLPFWQFPCFSACPPPAGSSAAQSLLLWISSPLARKLCTTTYGHPSMSQTIKFVSKSVKTGSNSGQKGIKNERKSSCPS